MSARVTIDREAWTDPAFITLARLLGLTDSDHALIKCARIWAWQTDNYTPDNPTYVVDQDTIEAFLGPGGAQAMVRAKLADEEPDGFFIRGSVGRIEWLYPRRAASQKGGEATKRKADAAKRRKEGNKQRPNPGPEPGPNEGPKRGPLTLTPDPTPDPPSPPPPPDEVRNERASAARAIAGARAARAAPEALSLEEMPVGWSADRSGELGAACEAKASKGVDVENEIAKFGDEAMLKGWRYLPSQWRFALAKWIRQANEPTGKQLVARENALRAERVREREKQERATTPRNVVALSEQERDEFRKLANNVTTDPIAAATALREAG